MVDVAAVVVAVGHVVLAIVAVEYSAAFWILTRGRWCRVPAVELVAFVVVALDVHAFDVTALDVDGVDSNSSCCTDNISTYSSRPDGLAALFNLESLIVCVCVYA